MAGNLDTSQVKTWRSIVTLVVFVATNVVVLFPFHIPFYVPRIVHNATLDGASAMRIISPRETRHADGSGTVKYGSFVRLVIPMNFVTAPLLADLFLLAIQAIGRQEVHDGTIGANNISPINVMVFFLSLAYIAISIDASGLIRYLAYRVLRSGGTHGRRLFFYLYIFFFGLGAFIGNDPIILSGTPFLAYLTRAASNIEHPRAWIYMQFSIANIASAILVSSNPTNLVLAGAFGIKFIVYTANMIVPVAATVIILFPFLLYVIYRSDSLIPRSITLEELPDESKGKRPRNPNIPYHPSHASTQDDDAAEEENQLLLLEEIMNPYLDKKSAVFGAVVMAATLITVLAVNAASPIGNEPPVYWVTLPAAAIMFCWDLTTGWLHRSETRMIAQQDTMGSPQAIALDQMGLAVESGGQPDAGTDTPSTEDSDTAHVTARAQKPAPNSDTQKRSAGGKSAPALRQRTTLVSAISKAHRWSQETFPTTMTVFSHLPFALVPFALSMFVLVQALVTKGWVSVFAYGWDHWVTKTGTVGAVGGMAFLGVILCNAAGTNIGTTILLSRVIQAWQQIHQGNGIPISNRTFWATVYSMAIGVNYGAFSLAFSASLAGLLWRDILARKGVRIGDLDFARQNVPIIAIAMVVGCVVLIGEVYVTRDISPYS